MRYLSVCAGIEAATVAWHPLGWNAAAYSEIEAFPRAVLSHHYPTVPLHGDFTTIEGNEYGPIDLLVGGTPCQDFSVAGLRAGIAGDRGNLTLEFLRLASRTEPRWIVWENVPGVLSSDGGRALGAFLGGLAELGYGFAYRVLDAQHFGLAQRRARVFVVGYLGDWRRAAAVLFERESLQGHPAPSREAGQRVANSLVDRPDRGGGNSEGQRLITDPLVMAHGQANAEIGRDQCPTLTLLHEAPILAHSLRARANASHRADSDTYVAHPLRAEGFDASEDGTGRGTPLVTAFEWQRGATQHLDMLEEMSPALIKSQTPAICFSAKDHGADAGPLSPTLRSGGHHKSHANGGVMPAVAFPINTQIATRHEAMGEGTGLGIGSSDDPAFTLQSAHSHAVGYGSAVRRLTPRECERLQGFPDDYTLVTYRGKPASDGPRYKALGNSMAVPVMAWIGRRIEMVEGLTAFGQSTAPAVRALASHLPLPLPNRTGEG